MAAEFVPRVAARLRQPAYLVACTLDGRLHAPFACWEMDAALPAAAVLARELDRPVGIYAWELGRLVVSITPGPATPHPPVFILLENWYALDENDVVSRLEHKIPAGVVGPFKTTDAANLWFESWRSRGYEPKGLPVARWGWLPSWSPERVNTWAAQVEITRKANG